MTNSDIFLVVEEQRNKLPRELRGHRWLEREIMGGGGRSCAERRNRSQPPISSASAVSASRSCQAGWEHLPRNNNNPLFLSLTLHYLPSTLSCLITHPLLLLLLISTICPHAPFPLTIPYTGRKTPSTLLKLLLHRLVRLTDLPREKPPVYSNTRPSHPAPFPDHHKVSVESSNLGHFYHQLTSNSCQN